MHRNFQLRYTDSLVYTKNCWIKNVNSFAPTDFVGFLETLYNTNYDEVVGTPKVYDAPMKSNITNIFCEMTKAQFALETNNYWGEKVCNVAYNASI